MFLKSFYIYSLSLIMAIFFVGSIYGSLVDPENNILILEKTKGGKYDIYKCTPGYKNRAFEGSIAYKNIATTFKRLDFIEINLESNINFSLPEAYIDSWTILTHLAVMGVILKPDFIATEPFASLLFSTPQIIYSFLKFFKTKKLLTQDPEFHHHEVGIFLSACTCISPILGAVFEWIIRNDMKDKLLSSHEYKVLDFHSNLLEMRKSK